CREHPRRPRRDIANSSVADRGRLQGETAAHKSALTRFRRETVRSDVASVKRCGASDGGLINRALHRGPVSLHDEHRQLGAPSNSEQGENTMQVNFYCTFRNAEPVSHFLVGETGCDEYRNFTLTLGEVRKKNRRGHGAIPP